MNTRRNQIDFPFNFLTFREFREHLLHQFFSISQTGIHTVLDELRIENFDFSVLFDLFVDRNFVRNCLGPCCRKRFLLECFFAVDAQPIDESPGYRVILPLKELRVERQSTED